MCLRSADSETWHREVRRPPRRVRNATGGCRTSSVGPHAVAPHSFPPIAPPSVKLRPPRRAVRPWWPPAAVPGRRARRSLGRDGNSHRRPAFQRSVLVRERAQVQALPQAARGADRARTRSARCGPCRRHRPPALRRHRAARPVERAAHQVARAHRAHAPGRRRWPPRSCAWPASRSRPASPPTRSTRSSTSCTIERGAYPSPLNYNGFPKSVCTSVNEVICHGIPDARALQDGDIVNIDVTVFLDGVHGDTNATFFVGDVDDGEPPPRARHRGVHVARHRGRANRAARSATSAGPSRTTPSRTATAWCGRSSATASASSSTPTSRSSTTTSRGRRTIMRPGMTFTIEPMITLGTWQHT